SVAEMIRRGPRAERRGGGTRAMPSPSRIIFQLNTSSGDVEIGTANAASRASPHRNIHARRPSRHGSIGRINRDAVWVERYGGGCAAGIAIGCGRGAGAGIV